MFYNWCNVVRLVRHWFIAAQDSGRKEHPREVRKSIAIHIESLHTSAKGVRFPACLGRPHQFICCFNLTRPSQIYAAYLLIAH